MACDIARLYNEENPESNGLYYHNGTYTSENEYCMLLSDNAKSISLPMLLCGEEDVEGNHGVASGKVNRDELLYIMSRGF